MSKQSELSVDKLLSTIGLVDVILGSLVLYWMRLYWGNALLSLFPSTGTQATDFALLILTAAFVGKILLLFVTMMMGLKLNHELHRQPNSGDDPTPFQRLQVIVTKYTKKLNVRPVRKTQVLDAALAYLHALSPQQVKTIERVETSAMFSYGGALISALYAAYFLKASSIALLWLAPTIGAVLFLILAGANTHDYLVTLVYHLEAAALRPEHPKQGGQNDGTDVQN